jgi:eukaryotic-like serine/threonine-protein kinase
MTPDLDRGRWDRIATIFDRALGAPDVERRDLLDQLCGSDETIRREVEDMLEAHERSPGLIAERRLVISGEHEPFDGMLPTGARVGPYRIESLIGSGGMGDVYRAERADGAHHQTVALKVLRPGYRTAEMVRRFRIEREALARLVHPGIATILDGGSLEDGRPYIVLQFVDGLPVTTYCTVHQLALRERLALFLRIVDAVQFAHGRLVVHRDLKPSNILVEQSGTPRLLDFGIAKLLDLHDASLGAATAPDVRLFTPEYAAPEQFRGEAPTTATDVHALGVLLFEMLTGTRPFSNPIGGRSHIESAVLETPAPAPSSVVASRADARRLRGDLDRIVLMALRKEPGRRYASAGQFGEDVERYLAGRPVMAWPDSAGYRLGKFVRRNQALVGGGAAIALLVIGFAVTSALQARRISRERDRAERERTSAEDVLRILTGLFERGNPNTHPGGDTLRVTSLLDTAESQVATMTNDLARQATLWRTVGRMRIARGEYARGIELLTRAYEQRRKAFGSDDLEAARVHHEIALALVSYRGEMAAQPVLDSSLTELRRLLGETHDDVRAAMSDLLMVTYDSLAARSLLARVMELERASPSRDPIAIAKQLHRRATERLSAKRYGEAVALFQATLDIVKRQLPAEHDDVRTVERNLALALRLAGHFTEAESMQRADVALETRLNHSAVARGMAQEALALTFFAEKRADSAEAEERAALDAFRAGAAPEHWRIWSAQRNLAIMMAARGRVAAGLAVLDSAIDVASTGRDSSTEVGYLTAQRVPFLLRLGRIGDASQAVVTSERMLGISAAVSSAHRADVHRYAGMAALASGDARRAADRFRAAVALVEPPGKPETVPDINSCLLGVSLARLGQSAEARSLLDKPCTAYASQGIPDPLIVGWIGDARRVAR